MKFKKGDKIIVNKKGINFLSSLSCYKDIKVENCIFARYNIHNTSMCYVDMEINGKTMHNIGMFEHHLELKIPKKHPLTNIFK